MSRADVDALARLLDRDPTLNGEATAEVRSLGVLAAALDASAVSPRPEFRSELRASLVTEARSQLVRAARRPRARLWLSDATARWAYSTRLAAVSGIAAFALSTTGIALAAQRSLPDDPLYTVKRGIDLAELALATDPVDRGTRQLGQARERLGEAQAAAESGRPELAAGALHAADELARTGAGELIAAAAESGDTAALDTVAAFVRRERALLEGVRPTLAGPAVTVAADLDVSLTRITDRVAVLGGGPGACPPGVTAGTGDFDFAAIPPASEAFQPGPCSAPTSDPTAPPTTGAPPEAEPGGGGGDRPPVGEEPGLPGGPPDGAPDRPGAGDGGAAGPGGDNNGGSPGGGSGDSGSGDSGTGGGGTGSGGPGVAPPDTPAPAPDPPGDGDPGGGGGGSGDLPDAVDDTADDVEDTIDDAQDAADDAQGAAEDAGAAAEDGETGNAIGNADDAIDNAEDAVGNADDAVDGVGDDPVAAGGDDPLPEVP